MQKTCSDSVVVLVVVAFGLRIWTWWHSDPDRRMVRQRHSNATWERNFHGKGSGASRQYLPICVKLKHLHLRWSAVESSVTDFCIFSFWNESRTDLVTLSPRGNLDFTPCFHIIFIEVLFLWNLTNKCRYSVVFHVQSSRNEISNSGIGWSGTTKKRN